MKKIFVVLLMLCSPAMGQNYLRDDGIFHSVVEGTTTGQVLGNTSGDLAGLTVVSPLLVSSGNLSCPTCFATGSAFANPTGTIGLTAVNGVLTTALRSDAAPPLSQAIVPTWTGLHTFNDGVAIGNPLLSGTFTGSAGAALFALNQSGAAASATVPEIGAQFTLTSNVGTANKNTAYKIGFTSSVIGSTNSASVYGGNIITQGVADSYLVTGLESDINNTGGNADTLAATTAAYGFVAASNNSSGHRATAGYWVTGRWNYGVAVSDLGSNPINTAAFYDNSTAATSLLITGTHTTGISLSGATISGNQIAATGFSVGSTGVATMLTAAFSGSTATTGPSIFQNSNILVFSGGTSGYAWNNQAVGATLMTLTNAGLLGLGTTSPILNLVISSDAPTAARLDSYTGSGASGAQLQMRTARGTTASPTASQLNDRLFSFAGFGYGATAFASAAKFIFNGYASENWSDSAQGTYAQIETTASGGTTRAVSITFQNSGGVSIGTTTDPGIGSLQVNANIFAPNLPTTTAALAAALCWTVTTGQFQRDTNAGGCLVSSARYKHDIRPLEGSLAEVMAMRPVSFMYNDNVGIPGAQVGFVAEHMAQVDPRLVGFNPNGEAQSVRYMQLTAQLAGAIQELKSDNDNLWVEVRKLRKKSEER